MKLTLEKCMKKSDCQWSELDSDVQDNAKETIRRVNALECDIVCESSSFVRSKTKQINIYQNKAALKLYPFTDGNFVRSKVPMGSAHLSGEAIDIYDPNGKLKEWVKANVAKLEKVGLWCEAFEFTELFVHFQTRPPKSGNRFFKP